MRTFHGGEGCHESKLSTGSIQDTLVSKRKEANRINQTRGEMDDSFPPALVTESLKSQFASDHRADVPESTKPNESPCGARNETQSEDDARSDRVE